MTLQNDAQTTLEPTSHNQISEWKFGYGSPAKGPAARPFRNPRPKGNTPFETPRRTSVTFVPEAPDQQPAEPFRLRP